MGALVLYNREAVVARELRTAWATGRRVALSLDGHTDRIEGHVRHVAATGVTVQVGDWLVPMSEVLAVHNPSLLADSTARADEPWHGPPLRHIPQREQIPGTEHV